MRPVIPTEQKIRYELDLDDKSQWLSVTTGELARRAFYYVQESGHFYCGPKYFTEREHLQSYLIKCTLGGQGQLEYRDRTYILNPGDVFFLKCDEYQRYQTYGEYWDQIWVHFNGAGAYEYFSNFYEAAGACVVKLPRTDEISEAINKILSLYRFGGMYADIMASKLVVDVLTEIMIAATGVNDNAAHFPRAVQESIDLIQANYRQQVTLDFLSEGTSLNKQYLQKLFKKHTGMTPNSFLALTRVNRAKELLRFSDMYVVEIAADVGMENTSHFIKTFKEITGLTPNAYRKMWSAGTFEYFYP